MKKDKKIYEYFSIQFSCFTYRNADLTVVSCVIDKFTITITRDRA